MRSGAVSSSGGPSAPFQQAPPDGHRAAGDARARPRSRTSRPRSCAETAALARGAPATAGSRHARPPAACSGPRSTTTTRATSTSSPSPSRSPAARSKVLVAIADVDALVAKGSAIDGHARHEHDLGLHGRRDLPDAAREALDRPHVARRGRGPRSRSSSRWWCGADGAVARVRRLPRASCGTAPSSPTTRVAAWLDGDGAPPRAGSPRCRGWRSSSGSRTGSRRR